MVKGHIHDQGRTHETCPTALEAGYYCRSSFSLKIAQGSTANNNKNSPFTGTEVLG